MRKLGFKEASYAHSQSVRDGDGYQGFLISCFFETIHLYTRQHPKCSIRELHWEFPYKRAWVWSFPTHSLKRWGNMVRVTIDGLNEPFKCLLSRRINTSQMVPRGTLGFRLFDHCSIPIPLSISYLVCFSVKVLVKISLSEQMLGWESNLDIRGRHRFGFSVTVVHQPRGKLVTTNGIMSMTVYWGVWSRVHTFSVLWVGCYL